ncbi:MAG TPA: FHA domain-containing protein [Gemmataceae bacterium]|nr:FHA domain-containing protein [Gemmataceae bacterium]
MSTIFVIEAAAAVGVTPAQFLLRDAVSLIGRSDDCDIIIDAPSVSRRHAELQVTGCSVVITDLGSTNGTYVDERRVEKALAGTGQRLRFGKVPFVLWERSLRYDGLNVEEETEDCNSDEVASAIAARVQSLSQGQRRVYDLLVRGISDKQIGRRLDLSPHTVHTHIRAIFKILEVHSRLELMACLARREG